MNFKPSNSFCRRCGVMVQRRSRYVYRANRERIREERERWFEELEELGSSPLKKDPAPRFFFHSTTVRAAEHILSSGRLQSQHFVSLSERPLLRGPVHFGNVALKFAPSIKDQLVKVKYDLKWLFLHPRIAAYIIGPGNAAPSDMTKEERLELAEDVLASRYRYQQEWVSWQQSDVEFRPSELRSILVENASLLGKVWRIKDRFPDYDHVDVHVLS